MELKNTSKGLWAEAVVAKNYQDRNWKILKHRIKLKFGEMDLIFQRGDQIHFVEVKTLHNTWMSFDRIKKDQMLRLQKNHNYYTHRCRYPIHLKIIFVDPAGKIEIVSLS